MHLINYIRKDTNMIKWTVNYTNYNGEDVTEDLYFHLNKAELTTMQFEANGAFGQYLERLVNERDIKRLGQEFRKIILNSYGKKSDDGRLFRKSKEMREEFEQSEAYSTLFMELLGDEDKATKFIKGILPADLQNTESPNRLPKLAE